MGGHNGGARFMGYLSILWDDVNDPDGNVEHIAEHGLDIEDVEHVLSEPSRESHSHSSGLPVVWGYTPDGRYMFVVYEQIDAHMIRVVTAYQVSAPGD